MLGLCCNETYITMTNYDGGHDDRNEDGNDDDNAASGSGSDNTIFNLITTPWSNGGLIG